MAFLAPIPSRQETPSVQPMPSSPGPAGPLESLRALTQGSPVEKGASWLRGLMQSALQAPGADALLGGPWGGLGALIRAKPAPGILTQVVDEAGKPQTVYHGTSRPFDKLNQDYASDTALYGQGLYHTEAPYIAGGNGKTFDGYSGRPYTDGDYDRITKGYTSQIEHYRERQAAAQAIVDKYNANPPKTYAEMMDGTHTAYHDALGDLEFIREQLPSLYGGLKDQIHRMPAPNVRPAKLDIRNPFDADDPLQGSLATDPWVKDFREFIERHGYSVNRGMSRLERGQEVGEDITRGKVYQRFSQMADGDGRYIPEIRPLIRKYLSKELGHDGITHIGGGNTGNDPHRVWIAWDENQIKPPYSK